MSISLENQQIDADSGDTSITHSITFSFSPTAGNYIIVGAVLVDSDLTDVINFSDLDAGWSLSTFTNFAVTRASALFFKKSDGTETGFSFEVDELCDSIMIAIEVSGLDSNTSTVIDVQSTTTEDSPVKIFTTDTIDPTDDDCFIFVMFGWGLGTDSVVNNYNNSFTELFAPTESNASNTAAVGAAYRIVSADASYDTTIEISDVRRSAGDIAAFRIAQAVVPPEGSGKQLRNRIGLHI